MLNDHQVFESLDTENLILKKQKKKLRKMLRTCKIISFPLYESFEKVSVNSDSRFFSLNLNLVIFNLICAEMLT